MGFKELVKKYSREDIKFTNHAEIKLLQMNFDKNFVVEKLFDVNRLIYEEYQEAKKTYKLIYEHSKDYRVVIIVSLNRMIRIVTVYKTSKLIQKLIKEGGAVHISRNI